MDAYHRNLDKGLSGSDVPHRVVVTLLYETPKFKGNRLLGAESWVDGGPASSKPTNRVRRLR
jgi:hypothetical protein